MICGLFVKKKIIQYNIILKSSDSDLYSDTTICLSKSHWWNYQKKKKSEEKLSYLIISHMATQTVDYFKY